MLDFNGDGTWEVMSLTRELCESSLGVIIAFTQNGNSTDSNSSYSNTESLIASSRLNFTQNKNIQSKPAPVMASSGAIILPLPIKQGSFADLDFDRFKQILDQEPELKKPYEPGRICWNFGNFAERSVPEFQEFISYTNFACCEEDFIQPKIVYSQNEEGTGQIIRPAARQKAGYWQIRPGRLGFYGHVINDYHFVDGEVKYFEPYYLRLFDSNKYSEREQDAYKKYLEVDMDLNKNKRSDAIEAVDSGKHRKICLLAPYNDLQSQKEYLDQKFGPEMFAKIFIHTPIDKKEKRPPGLTCAQFLSSLDPKTKELRGGQNSAQLAELVRNGALDNIFDK